VILLKKDKKMLKRVNMWVKSRDELRKGEREGEDMDNGDPRGKEKHISLQKEHDAG